MLKILDSKSDLPAKAEYIISLPVNQLECMTENLSQLVKSLYRIDDGLYAVGTKLEILSAKTYTLGWCAGRNWHSLYSRKPSALHG